MAEYNLGRVAFLDRGVFSPTETYNKWDFVTNIDSTYLCISTVAITGQDVLDTTYWKCIADGKPATLAAAAANLAVSNIPELIEITETEINNLF